VYVIGVDLCGPAATHNTGVATFTTCDGPLDYVNADCDGSDASLLRTVNALSGEGPVVVGLDAPLSYQPGGGDRHRDKELRKQIVARGMHSGSVMTPTAPRMVYLTLRGIAVAKLLSSIRAKHPMRIVEVHPGASLCFRDAPLEAIRTFATSPSARAALLKWLRRQGFCDAKVPAPCTSHFVAACAAAVAAADWAAGNPKWLAEAERPWHPYDFVA
jgi:predicted nuclease with RNAse H fold